MAVWLEEIKIGQNNNFTCICKLLQRSLGERMGGSGGIATGKLKCVSMSYFIPKTQHTLPRRDYKCDAIFFPHLSHVYFGVLNHPSVFLSHFLLLTRSYDAHDAIKSCDAASQFRRWPSWLKWCFLKEPRFACTGSNVNVLIGVLTERMIPSSSLFRSPELITGLVSSQGGIALMSFVAASVSVPLLFFCFCPL